MHAIIFNQHSPDFDVYEYVDNMPVPEIGPDEVLIKVHYAALNRLDDWVRRGWKGLDLSFPHIPGSDFAGEIAAVGDQVEGWEIGQRVSGNPTLFCNRCHYCQCGDHHLCEHFSIVGEHVAGSYAEYMKIPARNLIAVPEGFDLKLAAAASLAHLTAWRNLIVDGGLRPGETVLIVGSGGGVNIAALQLAKLAGAMVWVIAGNAAKAEKARALGADWVHDRSADANWGKAVWKKSKGRGVDVVVDNVGTATWPSSLRCLAKQGRLLTVGGTSGYGTEISVSFIFVRQLRIIGSSMGNMHDARQMFKLLFQGKFTPAIDSVWPLASYPKALRRMVAGEHFGKIIIEIAANMP